MRERSGQCKDPGLASETNEGATELQIILEGYATLQEGDRGPVTGLDQPSLVPELRRGRNPGEERRVGSGQLGRMRTDSQEE
jgi:hypothetical protein